MLMCRSILGGSVGGGGGRNVGHVVKVLDENTKRSARSGDSHDGAIGPILVGETVLKGVVDELFDSGDPVVAKSKTVIVASDRMAGGGGGGGG